MQRNKPGYLYDRVLYEGVIRRECWCYGEKRTTNGV